MKNKKANAALVWNAYNKTKPTHKELEKIYKKTLEAIYFEIKSLQPYLATSRTARYDRNRLKEANLEIKKHLKQLRLDIEDVSTKGMKQSGIYLNRGANKIRGGPEVKFNEKHLESMLAHPWKGSTFSKRIWGNIRRLNKSIQLNFTKGVQLGKTIDQLANMLSSDMKVSLNKSKRLVRTETMRYLNDENLRDMYIRGYTQVQEVVTIDERTSSECAVHQGMVHPIERIPELPRHPNCRCTLIPVVGSRLSREEVEVRLLKEKMTLQLGKLTEEETRVITEMTGSLSQKINSQIVSNKNISKLKREIAIVDSALSKGAITHNVTVTRVTDVRFLDVYKGGRKIDVDSVLNLKGKVATNPIFTSTSLNKNFQWRARNTTIVLDVPKGTKNALYIKDLSLPQFKYQEEILFGRNLQYVIEDVTINADDTVLLKGRVIGYDD